MLLYVSQLYTCIVSLTDLNNTTCIATTSVVISDSPSAGKITTNIPTTTNVILTINSLPEHSSNGVMTEPSGSGMSFIDLSGSGITEPADTISENTFSSHFSSSTSHILKTMTTIDNTLQNSITPTTTPRGKSYMICCNMIHIHT